MKAHPHLTGRLFRDPTCTRCPPAARVGRAVLAGAAAWLLAGGLLTAQAQVPNPDAQLGDGLAALPVAPLVAPRSAVGTVVPAQVLRWRLEAKDLEHGDNGLTRDSARAATLYCQAARYGDAEAQYSLAWMLANGRGIERDDAQAAHLFAAAAEQGMPQAKQMAATLGTPLGEPPPCLRPPEPEKPKVAAAPPRPPRPVAVAPVVPAPPPAPAAPPVLPPPANAPAPIVRFVQLVAPDYKLSPNLVLAIMATESGFNPNAVSPKNAQGLMQLIPDTAARFKVRNILDPAQNIRGGMAYLRWLMAYFEGDVSLVAAAYNAGEGAVERYRGVPPYAETREYVRRIVVALGGYLEHPFDPSVTGPSDVLTLMRGGTKRR